MTGERVESSYVDAFHVVGSLCGSPGDVVRLRISGVPDKMVRLARTTSKPFRRGFVNWRRWEDVRGDSVMVCSEDVLLSTRRDPGDRDVYTDAGLAELAALAGFAFNPVTLEDAEPEDEVCIDSVQNLLRRCGSSSFLITGNQLYWDDEYAGEADRLELSRHLLKLAGTEDLTGKQHE